MFVAECWFRDSGQLSAFVKELEQIEGVRRICPAIVFERLK